MLDDIVVEVDSVPDTRVQALESRLAIEARIGHGSTANVYLARRRGVCNGDESRSTRVILKVLSKVTEESDAQAASVELQKEADAMAALQGHPNIIAFYGLTWIEAGINDEGLRLPSWAIQMEYCKGGDLHDKASAKRFVESEALPVMVAILRGLSHMHELGYMHRDIKPENVLSTEGNVNIADFGICCHISDKEEMRRQCGSPGYVAPEVLIGQPYGPNVDCFSAGTLLYFILSGRVAFGGENAKAILKKSVTRPLDFRRSVRLECVSDSCKEFMLTLTTKDPLSRPSSKNALQSMWISQGTSWSSCEPESDCACNVGDSKPQTRGACKRHCERHERSYSEASSPSGRPTPLSDRLSDMSTTFNFSSPFASEGSEASFASKGRATFADIEKSEAEEFRSPSPLLYEPTRPEGRPGQSKKPFRSWLRQSAQPL
jgi:serine/threonine protein kinase